MSCSEGICKQRSEFCRPAILARLGLGKVMFRGKSTMSQRGGAWQGWAGAERPMRELLLDLFNTVTSTVRQSLELLTCFPVWTRPCEVAARPPEVAARPPEVAVKPPEVAVRTPEVAVSSPTLSDVGWIPSSVGSERVTFKICSKVSEEILEDKMLADGSLLQSSLQITQDKILEDEMLADGSLL